jgi:PEP-CTERM motif
MNRILTAALFTTLASVGFAGNLVVCSTGLQTASSSGCGTAVVSPTSGNGLLPDGNWQVSVGSSGTFQSAFVTTNGVGPVLGGSGLGGGWTFNTTNAGSTAGSAWIMPGSTQTANFTDQTQYTYRTSFDLTGYNLSTVNISGMWNGDNEGLGVYLNGILISQGSLPSGGQFALSMVNFSIPIGSSAFISGINTLDFKLLNDFTGNGTKGIDNPTGVRVQFISATGTFGNSSVPEPSSFIMLGLGLAALGGLARKHKA